MFDSFDAMAKIWLIMKRHEHFSKRTFLRSESGGMRKSVGRRVKLDMNIDKYKEMLMSIDSNGKRWTRADVDTHFA